MSTDAGSAAAPEDAAVREESSERPGLESEDPGSADSATSTPETADRGVDGAADAGSEHTDSSDGESGADDTTDDDEDTAADSGSGSDSPGGNPAEEGFVASLVRDSTVTGLPGETGAPPAEPHAPQAQQEGDEPVGSEPPVGDNPHGAD